MDLAHRSGRKSCYCKVVENSGFSAIDIRGRKSSGLPTFLLP